MADKVIENPILNRPYEEPTRHFEFDAEGITNRVAARRRPSSHFSPVPTSRKGSRQLELTELTADLIQPNKLANRIRDHVGVWRAAGYDNVAPTTRRLLEHWADPERENKVLFCQREAAETAIYLAEVAAAHRRRYWIRNELARRRTPPHNDQPPPRRPEDGDRLRQDRRDGDADRLAGAEQGASPAGQAASPNRFLVVTPGHHHSGSAPRPAADDPDNYYRLRDLVPADLRGGLGQAQIVITNYHAFLLARRHGDQRRRRLTKDVSCSGRPQGRPVHRDAGPDGRAASCRDLGPDKQEHRRAQRRGPPLLSRPARWRGG